MTVDYKPDYSNRDAYYANKDRASAKRDLENINDGPKPRNEPKAHDYRRLRWGHSLCKHIVSDCGTILSVSGYGSGICPGDFIIWGRQGLANRYFRVEKVKYWRDPPDRFEAILIENPTPMPFTVDPETNQIVKTDQIEDLAK